MARSEAQPAADAYFTVEALGPKRSLTPEGFLLVRDCPLARTGMQLYGAGETPIDAVDGMVRIEREPDEVFHPDTLASLNGKPVVNEHPEDGDGGRLDVTPDNWRELAIGHVMNPRRGEGADEDLLLGDLMITDRNAIDLIDAGKRELSCGYAAEYEETGPGRGRQTNIRANHMALVERGRCGPRCAIGDELSPIEEDKPMAKTSWADRIREAFRARDQGALENAIEEGGGGESGGQPAIHVHLPNGGGGGGNGMDQPNPAGGGPNGGPNGGSVEQRIVALEAAVGEIKTAVAQLVAAEAKGGAVEPPAAEPPAGGGEEEPSGDNQGEGNKMILPGFEIEAPPGTADQAKKARDSAFMADSFANTVALGEILAPGVRLPTFDRATAPAKTFDVLCGFRRTVLDLAYNQPETREMIDEVTGGAYAGAKGLRCDRVRDLFLSVGALKRRANNAPAAGNSNPDGPEYVFGGGIAAGIQTPADIQRVLTAHYAGKA